MPDNNRPLTITMVSSEVAPFAKTGGLGDMVPSLSIALERAGLNVNIIMPGYRWVFKCGLPISETETVLNIPIANRREKAVVRTGKLGRRTTVYFVCSERYFDRDNLYGYPDKPYPDNAERFVFFTRAALEIMKKSPPDVLHAHDWQSALSTVFLRTQPRLYPELSRVKTVLTIHNLGFQGLFPYSEWRLLNLDDRYFTPDYLEFYGKVNFLKGGIIFADALTTVSPTYAREITAQDGGHGLDGVLRKYASKLTGILNGADYDIWNQKTDPLIAAKYSLKDPGGKRACKSDLQRLFHLRTDPDVPIIGAVSRLTDQKGFDLVERALPDLMRRNVQFVLLGTGEKRYMDFFTAAARKYPGRMGVQIVFDERVAHRVIAGADIFIMPSRYEPGGLTQLYSLKYGTIPIVRATGGLKDSVTAYDSQTGKGTGFLFEQLNARAFLGTVDKAFDVYHEKKHWTRLMRNAMEADFSWKRSGRRYIDLYRGLAEGD